MGTTRYLNRTEPVELEVSDIQIGAVEIKDGVTDERVNINTSKQMEVFDNSPKPTLTIENAIESLDFDLQASAFSEVTDIDDDYIFDSLVMNFTTTEVKTITVKDRNGSILWGGDVDQSSNNKGYNTTAQNFNLCFDQAFNTDENITVEITQTSGVCIVDVELKIKKASTSLSGSAIVNAGLNGDYFFNLTRGQYPKLSVVRKVIFDDSIGTSRKVIGVNSTFNFQQSGVQIEVVSDSDDDDFLTGTGALTVEITYLDNNFDQQQTSINLDGQVSVGSIPTDIRRINNAFVSAAGEYAEPLIGGGNHGNITIRVFGGGDELAYIPNSTSSGVDSHAHFTVPAGKRAYLKALNIEPDANKALSIFLYQRSNANIISAPFPSKFLVGRSVGLEDPLEIIFEIPPVFEEKTDIWFEGKTEQAGGEVSIAMTIVLEDM